MANAESYSGANPPFFPLQGPRVQRDPDVRALKADNDLTQAPAALSADEEAAIWSQYEADPPAASEMKRASNVHRHRRWLIPAVLVGSLALGLGYAALNDKPAQIREPALTQNTIQNPRAQSAGMTPTAPNADAQPQIFDTPTAQTPAARPAPGADTPPASAIQRTEPRAARVAAPPPIVTEEAPPAPTYSRGGVPAEMNSQTAPISPAPGSFEATPPVAPSTESVTPSMTSPAPQSAPENAQAPQ